MIGLQCARLVCTKIDSVSAGLKRWYALWCLKRIHGANKDPNEGKSLDDIAKLYMQQILQPSDKKDPKIIDEKVSSARYLRVNAK